MKTKSDAASNRRRRILAVDDEPPILTFVQRALEMHNYEIVVAESGARALELAGKGEPFDALVTDLVMPHMTGDELARRLRAANPDLKVLYLTGFCDQLFRDKVTLWSAEAYLEKPATIKGLNEAVALLLFGTLGHIT